MVVFEQIELRKVYMDDLEIPKRRLQEILERQARELNDFVKAQYLLGQSQSPRVNKIRETFTTLALKQSASTSDMLEKVSCISLLH